jgi:hypothetical protein
MKTTICCVLGITTLLLLGGCNQAQSPAAVANDVSKASTEASAKDSKAMDSQDKTDAAANDSMASAQQSADAKKADAAADTAVTEAEGANKVALAKCEALSGDRQQACKDEANAALDMAKAQAKAMKADHN